MRSWCCRKNPGIRDIRTQRISFRAGRSHVEDGTVTKVRCGSVVYTDKYKSYDSLMFFGYKHLSVDQSVDFHVDEFISTGLKGSGHLSKSGSLNIMVFRYNHRHQDFYEILAKYITDFVQDPLLLPKFLVENSFLS